MVLCFRKWGERAGEEKEWCEERAKNKHLAWLLEAFPGPARVEGVDKALGLGGGEPETRQSLHFLGPRDE